MQLNRFSSTDKFCKNKKYQRKENDLREPDWNKWIEIRDYKIRKEVLLDEHGYPGLFEQL